MRLTGRRKGESCDVGNVATDAAHAPNQTKARALQQSAAATGPIIGHLTGRVIWDSSNLFAANSRSQYISWPRYKRLWLQSGARLKVRELQRLGARLRDGGHTAFAQCRGARSGRRSSCRTPAASLGWIRPAALGYTLATCLCAREVVIVSDLE